MGEYLYECPQRLITPETATVCRLLPLLEAGVLPCAGAALDQPATLMEAFHIVSAEVAAYHPPADKAPGNGR